MKTTQIMLAVIATFMITWICFGSIGWCLSELTFKECMSHGGTLMLLLVFGWIPSVIVGADLNESINNKAL